jgi:2-keto-4-pentenoate hydratase/2-oxohepta-3-ene-1,7-dioic acid hydratase in catechol pathway
MPKWGPEGKQGAVAFSFDNMGEAALFRVWPLAASARVPLADVELSAPVPRPPEFLGIGLNYRLHIAEAGLQPPDFPAFFNK